MTCPDCDGDRVALAVPPDYRRFAPDEAETVTVCPGCCRVTAGAADDATAGDPAALGDWPPAGDPGVGVALLVALLDSLALERGRIEALVAQVERDGADPLLALDRLADDPATDPFVDLGRRRPQLRQFLDG
jgi:hypothetical protein